MGMEAASTLSFEDGTRDEEFRLLQRRLFDQFARADEHGSHPVSSIVEALVSACESYLDGASLRRTA